MQIRRGRRRAAVILVGLALVVAAAATARVDFGGSRTALPWGPSAFAAESNEKRFQTGSQGIENGGAGGESFEAYRAAAEFDQARTAPSGIVAPGAYTNAYNQLTGLTTAGGAWTEVTDKPYDADDIDYRDYYSNSSGGSGLVTGRIVGLAADNAGNVYAAGANGGVWRSTTNGGNWTPIADGLPSLSSGDLQLDATGALWYATGEANTGGTSYAGSGVYRLASPTTGTFTVANRVGGIELESTTINSLRFGGGKVWAATLRGVWSHSLDSSKVNDPWKLVYVPNPTFLPDSLEPYLQTPQELGPTTGNDVVPSTTNAPYKNIVNDIAIDPRDPNHVLAAIGWRSGDSYNGFYETRNGGTSWTKINPLGGLDATDIGNVSFAFSGDGKVLYAMNQSPRKLNQFGGTSTYLDGIYVSSNGLAGPWNLIATSDKLSSSGSALGSVQGLGYSPGIQSWYNQFLIVDPSNANHVYAGLEEVYETKDGGKHWNTVGPYWNFYFGCWRPDSLYAPNGSQGCPQTTHSDQHAVAIGRSAAGAAPTLYVGNDGGVYKRPLNGAVNRNGNATDWASLNDGTINALQYYAVDVGKAKPGFAKNPDGNGPIVSGGLQDNGGSIYREGGAKMSSNFGGDGGDVLVDPENGCNIVQEYVVLAMRVTQTCARPDSLDAFLDLSKATTYSIAPPDINARFIAPFVANRSDIDEWMAGGNSLWVQSTGFAIRSGAAWKNAYKLPSAAQTYTALAMAGNKAVGGWCGPCNNAGFASGITIGTRDATKPSGWSFVAAPTAGLPNRFVGGVEVGYDGSIYAVMNGFSRRFTEGPGAGAGHVFKLNGTSWVDISANFPDVPANSVKALSNGALVVGTDLAVFYRAAAAGSPWQRLGSGLPLTAALDVEIGPDGNDLYAATHGRGIWKIQLP
jgi:hypothetical protein